MITKQEMKRALRLMGIVPGDTLLLHSAMTAIGGVEGGADAVIDAFLETIGEEGTLVMSTLTGWFAPFDAATSPSAVGYLSEVFRRRSGVLRSLHPVHSVCAYGKHAAFITEGHENCKTGCGEGTPYLKIRDLGGKALLLGVDMDRNTVMHSLEEAIDAKALGQAINGFLGTLSRKNRVLFLRRYWFGDEVSRIAASQQMRADAVSVQLHRIRQKLKNYLQKEGFFL